MNSQKYYLILPSITGILFFILYFILSLNNRLPYEDYTFISMTKDMGAINAMIHIYEVYSARWSAHTLAFSFSMLYEIRYFLLLFNLITLIILIFSFYLLLKKCLNNLLKFSLGNSTLVIYSILFTCCFFFSSYNIGEVWFWYMVNWMYIWSIISGNFLLWILLHPKLKPFHILFILILTAYIAGASESYSIIYILLLLVLFSLKKKNIASIFIENIATHSLLFSLALLVLFYMITIFAPGTWERKDMLREASFTEHSIMVMKAYGIIALFKTPKLIPYLILFGAPWMLLGLHFPSEQKIKIKELILLFLKSVLFIGLFVLIFIFPASWVLYDVPPARALSQISLLLSMYVSCIFFYTGHKVKVSRKISHSIILYTCVFSSCILSFQIVNQYLITRSFASEYDDRIIHLLHEKNSEKTNTVIFEPLPISGMIYSDELSPYSSSNSYFENAYNLKLHVVCK